MCVHIHWKLGSEGCMYTDTLSWDLRGCMCTHWKLGSEVRGCMCTHWKLGSVGIYVNIYSAS